MIMIANIWFVADTLTVPVPAVIFLEFEPLTESVMMACKVANACEAAVTVVVSNLLRCRWVVDAVIKQYR